MQCELAVASVECHGSKADAAQIRDYCLARAVQTHLQPRGVQFWFAMRVRPPQRDFGDLQPADISVGRERLVGTRGRSSIEWVCIASLTLRSTRAIRRVADGADLAFDFEPPVIGVHPERRETSVSDTCARVSSQTGRHGPTAAAGGDNRASGRGAWCGTSAAVGSPPSACATSAGPLRLQRSIERSEANHQLIAAANRSSRAHS